MCPFLLAARASQDGKLTKVNSNACCPTTKTKTVTQTGCAIGCVVPTQTVYRTTGCKTSATPTKTPVLTLIG